MSDPKTDPPATLPEWRNDVAMMLVAMRRNVARDGHLIPVAIVFAEHDEKGAPTDAPETYVYAFPDELDRFWYGFPKGSHDSFVAQVRARLAAHRAVGVLCGYEVMDEASGERRAVLLVEHRRLMGDAQQAHSALFRHGKGTVAELDEFVEADSSLGAVVVAPEAREWWRRLGPLLPLPDGIQHLVDARDARGSS